MTPQQLPVADLERVFRGLATAERPAGVFKALLDGARLAAPRVAMFLVRQGRIQGWGSVGYGAEIAKRQRAWSSTATEGWLGRTASGASAALDHASGSGDPDFGQPLAADAIAGAIRVKGRTIAIVLAERPQGGSPWVPELLGALVPVAELRLELDLARKRLDGGAHAGAEDAAAAPARARAEEAAIEPAKPAHSTAGADPQLETARRYAKLVATDIRLYNEEAVMLGRRHGDLIDRLGDNLDRGKETFLRRHADLGPAGLDILHDAFVQVLAAGDAHLLPRTAVG
jgi:hypothetical protein